MVAIIVLHATVGAPLVGRPIRESPGNHDAGNHKGCPYVGGTV